MGLDLSELVHFIGAEGPLLTRAKEVVKWLASTQEGLAIMKEAKQLHGKPVTVIVDDGFDILRAGFSVYQKEPMITCGPSAIQTAKLVTAGKSQIALKDSLHMNGSMQRKTSRE